MQKLHRNTSLSNVQSEVYVCLAIFGYEIQFLTTSMIIR